MNPFEQVWDVYVFDRSINMNLLILLNDQSRDVGKLTSTIPWLFDKHWLSF